LQIALEKGMNPLISFKVNSTTEPGQTTEKAGFLDDVLGDKSLLRESLKGAPLSFGIKATDGKSEVIRLEDIEDVTGM